jgi:hypothetical protein
MYQNGGKTYQMAFKKFQMAIKYTNIFRSKALQNIPNLGFFGLRINHLATLLSTSTSNPHTEILEVRAPIKFFMQKFLSVGN